MIDIVKCGAFIAALRKEQGLTQRELAARLEVTDKAVSRWETGKGLPDAQSMLTLSECFEVTVNELLIGERNRTDESSDVALMGVLQLADREKKQHRRLRIVMTIVLAVFLLLFALLIGHDLTVGGGVTLSSVCTTVKARHVAQHIEQGRFEKAAPLIAFSGRDRRIAEQEWIRNMHTMFDGTLEITDFAVLSVEEEDQFLFGTARLRVYDPTTEEGYTFDIRMAEQDGIAFGYTEYIGDHHPERGNELAKHIQAAMSTYNPG